MNQLLRNYNILLSTGNINPKFQIILNDNPTVIQQVLEKTCFLQYSAPLVVRLLCVINGVVAQPRCNTCNVIVTMRISGRHRGTFPQYCSSACVARNSKTKSKRRSTNLERYGHTNILQSDYCGKLRSSTSNQCS